MDAVCGQIASSAARQHNFKTCATRMGYTVRMLKRPCKTWWNSHYKSRMIACKALEVSNFLFSLPCTNSYCIDLLQIINAMIAADRRACFFKGVTISPSEWHSVELVNNVLKVRVCFSLNITRITYLPIIYWTETDLCWSHISSWGKWPNWVHSPSGIQTSYHWASTTSTRLCIFSLHW